MPAFARNLEAVPPNTEASWLGSTGWPGLAGAWCDIGWHIGTTPRATSYVPASLALATTERCARRSATVTTPTPTRDNPGQPGTTPAVTGPSSKQGWTMRRQLKKSHFPAGSTIRMGFAQADIVESA